MTGIGETDPPSREARLEEIGRCRREVSVEPSRPKAWKRLAKALETDEPEEAVLCWRRALDIDDRDLEARARLGRLLHALGRPGEAARHLRAAAETSPLEVKRWKALAAALQADGQAEAAALARRRGQVVAAERDAAAHLQALGFEVHPHGAMRPLPVGDWRFDPSTPFEHLWKEQCLEQVRSSRELLAGGDVYYVVDKGGAPITVDPVIPVEASGADRMAVEVETSEAFVAAFDEAALVGRGAILTRDGKVIADFLKQDLTKHHAVRGPGAIQFDRIHFLEGQCPVQRFDTPAALLAGPTDLSFGDWINNFPTRLVLLEAAGLDLPLVVNRRLPGKLIDILLALGVRRDRLLFHNPDGVSIFPRLYAPSWPLANRLKPMRGIYDIYQRIPRDPPPESRALIYLSRKAIGNRAMLNEEEVCALFARKGFQIVAPEELDLAATLRLFDNPLCVAGPYGSAIRNLVFCREKPVSLMVMPPYPEQFIKGVAVWFHQVGVPYAHVRGTPFDAGADVDANTASWTAPLDRIEAAIDAVLEAAARKALTG